MNTANPEIAGLFKAGQILRLKRHDLTTETGEEFDQPEARALVRCLQRLAVIPQVEGLALSRIKVSGDLYYTVVEGCAFSNNEDAGIVFEKITDTLYELGDTLGEIMPGSFINIGERCKFASVVRHLRGKSYTGDLDPIGIIHFV